MITTDGYSKGYRDGYGAADNGMDPEIEWDDE